MSAPRHVVRPAAAGDAQAIASLLAAGSLTPGAEDPSSPDRYAEAIERVRTSGGEVYVAAVADEVVGVCQVSRIEHLQHAGGRVAELESVHVAAGHRSEGVGGALLEACVAWAASNGCYRVQLTSNLRRPDAHRFYETNGFVGSHVGFKLALEPPGAAT
ncbi:MAG TPA: GNAT family N-acetyltransferase [Acidimicrobiales bacterium]